MERNIIDLHEKCLSFKDVMDINKKGTLLRGRVVIVDDASGEVVLDKDNLIVMRTRVFALEKMFNKVNTLNAGYNVTNNNTKEICLFKAGKGGTIEGQPFNVIPVIPTDGRTLGQEIPFRLHIEGQPAPEGYYDLRDLGDGTGIKGYFAKTFESVEWGRNIPEGTYSEGMDEVFVKLTLKITEDDFKTIEMVDENGDLTYTRSTFLNEIGLCIANPVKNDISDRMDNIELASRICFESEPYFNNTKSSTIYYYVYS